MYLKKNKYILFKIQILIYTHNPQLAVKHPSLSPLNPQVSASFSVGQLSYFSHFHQPPHHRFSSTTVVPESDDFASSSCRSIPSLAGTWGIRTSRRASSTSPAIPRWRVLTLCNLDFSFSWVLILSSSPPFLLH